MSPPKKNFDTPHKIISVTLLATGRLIMATENRMYELISNIWQPMLFADDPVDPPVPTPVPDPVLTPTGAATPGYVPLTKKPGLIP